MSKHFNPTKNDNMLIKKINVMYDALLLEEFEEEDWDEYDEERKGDKDDEFDDDPRKMGNGKIKPDAKH